MTWEQACEQAKAGQAVEGADYLGRFCKMDPLYRRLHIT